MRKIIIIALLITFSSNIKAQTNESVKEKKSSNIKMEDLIIKDRLFVDIFSSIWLNFNTETYKQRAINQGVNAAFLFDLPVKKNSPFSFGIGVGVTSHNLYSNAQFYIGKEYTTQVKAIDENIDYSKNKISFTNLNIPLEFRYFHSSGFKISAGIRVGLMADVHTKYYGREINGKDESVKIKNKKIPNYTKVPVEITFRSGWKYFGFHASYMITKMFEPAKGPQMYPFSLGISLSLY